MNNEGRSFSLYHYPLLVVPHVEIGLVIVSAILFPRFPWLLIASLLAVVISAMLGAGKVSIFWPELASIGVGIMLALFVLIAGQPPAILTGFLWPPALALMISGALTIFRKLVARLSRKSEIQSGHWKQS